MDSGKKDQLKGEAQDIKGRVERQAGEWTGDSQTQAKGAADQLAGKAHKAVGKAKEKVADINDRKEKKSLAADDEVEDEENDELDAEEDADEDNEAEGEVA